MRDEAAKAETPRPTRLPWPTTVTAVIALAALVMSGRSVLPAAVIAALALVATYPFRLRIDPASPMQWFVRVALIGGAYAYAHLDNPSALDYLIGPAWVRNFFGMYFAGEMALQAWRARSDNPRAPLVVLFLSGFVFLTACNTFDERYIRFVTPLYMLFLALGLRAYRRHEALDAPPSPHSPLSARPSASRRRGAAALSLGAHAAALVLGLGAGFGLYHTFALYRGEITDWGNNLLGQRLEEMDTSGMSEQPTLGRTFGLRGSPERVLRVTAAAGSSGGGYAGDPHLRGISFDTYTAGRWSPVVSDRGYVPPADPDIRVRHRFGEIEPAPTSIVRVTRLVRGNPLVYAPLNASEIDLTEADNLQWAPDSGGPIRTTSAPPFTYTLTVPARATFQGVLARAPDAAERKRCLAIPHSLDPRVLALARSIAGRLPRPEQKIDAITGYLMTHHAYSLTIDPGPGDPVSRFLLSDPPKAAHCEYFAASAALLLRCVGVPTRYVTGYYLHESDGPNAAVVRQRDAHAWAEAWVGGGTGWVTVDATPGDGRPDYQPEPISHWQAFQERLQDILQSLHDWLGDLKPEQVNLLVGTATAVTIGGGLIWFLLQRRRPLPDHSLAFAYTLPSEELTTLAARFERELSRRRVPLPNAPPRTWQEHLAALAPVPTLSDFLPAAHRFVALYERARFGAALTDTEQTLETLAALRTQLEQMEGEPAGLGSGKGTSQEPLKEPHE